MRSLVCGRQLDRTLYFVVRGRTGGWQFPETQPDRSKPLLTEAGAAHVTASYSGRVPPKLFFAGHAPAAVFKPAEASSLPVSHTRAPPHSLFPSPAFPSPAFRSRSRPAPRTLPL